METKLKDCACHRLMSLMTSDAFWRFLKLIRPPGRLSGLPSWINWSVDKKTPDILHQSLDGNETYGRTDERHARGSDSGHKRTILVEVTVAINSHFACPELGHVSLTDLFPCSL